MSIDTILNTISNFIWGPPLLILISGVGIYFTFRLGLLQIIHLPRAFVYMFKPEKGNNQKGDISAFAALSTALAATIGTGNIVGVATAIQSGGPGALFWMWLIAIFGMATKYAECLLAIKFRGKDKDGYIAGGPMYYIELGMGQKWKWLAKLFAFFGVLVASNFIAHQFASREKLPICLFISAGRFEDGENSILANSRQLKDVLTAKGYPFIYREYSTEHGYAAWQGILSEGLEALFKQCEVAQTSP